MKEIVIKIPDNKIQFFLELLQQLGFENYQKYDIPEEHISIVRERIEKSNISPDQLKDWDDVKDSFLK